MLLRAPWCADRMRPTGELSSSDMYMEYRSRCPIPLLSTTVQYLSREPYAKNSCGLESQTKEDTYLWLYLGYRLCTTVCLGSGVSC